MRPQKADDIAIHLMVMMQSDTPGDPGSVQFWSSAGFGRIHLGTWDWSEGQSPLQPYVLFSDLDDDTDGKYYVVRTEDWDDYQTTSNIDQLISRAWRCYQFLFFREYDPPLTPPVLTWMPILSDALHIGYLTYAGGEQAGIFLVKSHDTPDGWEWTIRGGPHARQEWTQEPSLATAKAASMAAVGIVSP